MIIKHQLTYWNRKGVVSMNPVFFIGNTKLLVQKKVCLAEAIETAYKHFKKMSLKFGGYYFFTRSILIPVDLDLIKRITTTDFEYFCDRLFHSHESDPLSSHIVALKGIKWKNMRNKLSPAFTPAKNKMVIPTVSECIKDLIVILDDEAKKGQAVEMKELNSRLMKDILASCAFGLEINALKSRDSDFERHLEDFFSPTIKDTLLRFLMLIFPEILVLFKVRSMKKELADFFLNVVEKTVKYREENHIVRNDFMHLLLQVRNNVKIEDDHVGDAWNSDDTTKSLTVAEIASQCLVFYLAGFESSSSTVTYCLYELALNHSVQETTRNEIKAVIAKHGALNFDAINEMYFLNKCIKETLRKYPAIPLLFRECTKTYKIPESNYVVEKGTVLFFPVYAIHRDPDIYPEPEKFDPERFSEENVNKRHPTAYIPFGNGPRSCIAYQFGIMTVKIILATLLNSYDFKLNSATEVPLKMDNLNVSLRPKDGVWFDIKMLQS